MTNPLLVDLTGAASLLAISRRRAAELVYSGELPSVKIGRCRRIAVADLETFVDGLRENKGAPLGGTDSQPALAVVGRGRYETKAVRGR